MKLNLTTFMSCILLYAVILSSCIQNTPLVPSLTPTVAETLPPTRTITPSATTTITATPTLNYKTIILTPDNVFSLSELVEWSTPDSGDFCEHLPPPQIVAIPDEFSLLSGKFVLCIYERIFTGMDLDTGSLVSSDDEKNDIDLGSPGGGEHPSYGVFARNNAYINVALPNHSGTNRLSYEYCENILRNRTNQTDHGALYVGEQFIGDIACVKTTEGQIVLLRVEKIYPAITLSVEFSFAVLRSE